MLVRMRCAGHPHIRATHDATFELVTGADITPRATCVVGVRTEVLEGSPNAVAGPIELILECEGQHQRVGAVANPWIGSDGSGVVVRRSGARLAGTLATDATAGAADLDRSLIDALRMSSAVLEVTVRRAAARPDRQPQLVLGRARAQGAVAGRKAAVLAAELSAADVVLADDAGARRWGDAASAVARSCLEARGRVLLLGTDELVGRRVPELLGDRESFEGGVHLEAFGMPATVAAAGMVGGTDPVALVPELSNSAAVDRALALVGQGLRVVTQGRAARSRRLLSGAPCGVLSAVLVLHPDTPLERYEVFERSSFGDALPEGTKGQVVVALGASGSGVEDQLTVDLVGALVDHGVRRSTIAAALAGQPGWSRNRAYDVVSRAGGPDSE